MLYEENYLTKAQEKRVEKILKTVRKFFKLESPPACRVMGANPTKMIEKLRISMEGKTKKEISKIKKEINSLNNAADILVKVIFEFDDIIKEIVVCPGWSQVGSLLQLNNIWTCLLKFPITDGFLFGRVTKKPKHGSGYYRFAPFELSLIKKNLSRLYEKINEEILNGTVDQFLLKMITGNPITDLFGEVRTGRYAFDQMKTSLQLIKSRQWTGIEMIDSLNKNKKLIEIMKKVHHYGTTIQQFNINYFQKAISEVDVSTICIPMEVASALQLINYDEGSHKYSLKAIYALSDALVEF